MENTEGRFNYNHGQIYEIMVSHLHPNPNQPRKELNLESIEKMSKSILDMGLINPITFTAVDGKLFINSGERRWRAFLAAGFEFIQAKYVDRDLLKISLAENFQRENLNPMDKAELYLQMKTSDCLTLSQIAEETGESISSISELLSLCRLPETIKFECRINPDFVLSRLVKIAKASDEKTMRKLFKDYCQELNGKIKRTPRRGPRDIKGVIARMNGMMTEMIKVNVNQTTQNEICIFFLKMDEMNQVMHKIVSDYKV